MKHKFFDFSSVLETISTLSALITVLTFPIFIHWIFSAAVKPEKGQFILVKEPRNLFEQYKLKQKNFAMVIPLRKFLMSFVIVFLQNLPRL